MRNIKRSPSSPYFPISVEESSKLGVSMGANPYRLKTVLIDSNKYVLFATSVGRKSLVPFGIAGF
jgi:hypothetical protein